MLCETNLLTMPRILFFHIFSLSLTFIFFCDICFKRSSNTTISLLLLNCSERSPHQSEDTLFAYPAILVFLKLHLSMCAGLSDFRFLCCGFCGTYFSFLVCLIVQKTVPSDAFAGFHGICSKRKGWHLFLYKANRLSVRLKKLGLYIFLRSHNSVQLISNMVASAV